METVQELIDKYLTPEQREKFIANLKRVGYTDFLKRNSFPKEVIIGTPFNWTISTEGYDYWKEIDRQYNLNLNKN